MTATAYRFGELVGPDLEIKETNTPRTINKNGTVTITYTVKNLGTVAAAGSTATLAYTGLTFVSATPAAEYDDATKKWTIGDLAAGATKTLAITLKGTTIGTFNTTATVATTTSPEGTPSNNSVALKVFVGTTPPPSPADPATGPDAAADVDVVPVERDERPEAVTPTRSIPGEPSPVRGRVLAHVKTRPLTGLGSPVLLYTDRQSRPRKALPCNWRRSAAPTVRPRSGPSTTAASTSSPPRPPSAICSPGRTRWVGRTS